MAAFAFVHRVVCVSTATHTLARKDTIVTVAANTNAAKDAAAKKADCVVVHEERSAPMDANIHVLRASVAFAVENIDVHEGASASAANSNAAPPTNTAPMGKAIPAQPVTIVEEAANTAAPKACTAKMANDNHAANWAKTFFAIARA
jgi:hypothetical protein